jgi:hypothetical protein
VNEPYPYEFHHRSGFQLWIGKSDNLQKWPFCVLPKSLSIKERTVRPVSVQTSIKKINEKPAVKIAKFKNQSNFLINRYSISVSKRKLCQFALAKKISIKNDKKKFHVI